MTTNEIKAIIAEKIAGQGNQVDIGGALASVLNAIIDSIPEGGGSVPEPVSLPAGTNLGLLSEEAYDRILANLNAGCAVVIVGKKPVTIVGSINSGIMYFDGIGEMGAEFNVLGVEEPEPEQ